MALVSKSSSTHDWVTKATAALPPAVAKEGADVEGQESQPNGSARHQVMKAKLTRVIDWK